MLALVLLLFTTTTRMTAEIRATIRVTLRLTIEIMPLIAAKITVAMPITQT